MDSGMSNILNSGFMPYTTAASLEMSDEPEISQSVDQLLCAYKIVQFMPPQCVNHPKSNQHHVG